MRLLLLLSLCASGCTTHLCFESEKKMWCANGWGHFDANECVKEAEGLNKQLKPDANIKFVCH